MPCESITNSELCTHYSGLKMDEVGDSFSCSMEEENVLKYKSHYMFRSKHVIYLTVMFFFSSPLFVFSFHLVK